MYGTAVRDYEWSQNTTSNEIPDQNTVAALPDYDEENIFDGSGNYTSTTEQVNTTNSYA